MGGERGSPGSAVSSNGSSPSRDSSTDHSCDEQLADTAERPATHGDVAPRLRINARVHRLAESAPGLDGPGDLGPELGVDQKLVDECGEDLLSGHAGDSQAVGGLSLPDVERAVCGGWQVDGTPCSLGARLLACRWLDESWRVRLSEARDALGWRRVPRWGCGGRVCAQRRAAGLVVTWVDAQLRRPFCVGPS